VEFEILSFEKTPESLIDTRFDCIWLNLAGYVSSIGIEKPTLQWIDWKLRGQISRSLISGGTQGEVPLFLPSQGRLKTPYVALWTHDEVLPEILKRNCEGQRWQSLLYFCTTNSLWEKVNLAFENSVAIGAKCFLTKG